MISLPRLARLAEAREFDRLLDEVARNGRPLPLPVRLRLSQPDSLPAAATGLALQRVVQLTYRPSALIALLARTLLDLQQDDGSFGSTGATAIAVASLLALADQVRSIPAAWARLEDRSGSARSATREELEHAALRAMHALFEAQERTIGALIDGQTGLIGDKLDSAIVLWQLGTDPRFAAMIRYEDLLASVVDAGIAHDRAAGPLVERVVGSVRGPWG